MKRTAKIALLGLAILVLIACNIPGSETDRKEQEYNYKLDQMAQEVAATENAQNQNGIDEPDPSSDAPAESQSGSINTEEATETNASTLTMVFEGTGTVIDYPWGTEDIEHSCPSGAKVTLTVEGDTCTTNFIYQAMSMGIDKVCSPYAENSFMVTGPYSSADGSCTFNAAPNYVGGSVNGAAVLMGAAKVDFWIQTSVENWVIHYYSDYLSPQP